MKLNLGCGYLKLNDAINIDLDKFYEPEIVWDLNKYPYPWEENSIDEVIAKDIIEHLEKPYKFLEEIWRILKKDGECKIVTPKYLHKNSWTDLTHLHHLTDQSLDYCDKRKEMCSKYPHVCNARFKIEVIEQSDSYTFNLVKEN